MNNVGWLFREALGTGEREDKRVNENKKRRPTRQIESTRQDMKY